MRLNLWVWLAIVGMSWTMSSSVTAQETYTAKMVRTKGLSQESVQVDLQISRWASQDEADALLEVLNEGGWEALKAALLDNDFGEAQVTGGTPRKVVWARVFPGQNGNSLMIVTNEPVYFPSDPLDEQADPQQALGVLTLEVNDRGLGRGRLAQAVALHVTDAGVLQIESARPATVEIEDVRRQQ